MLRRQQQVEDRGGHRVRGGAHVEKAPRDRYNEVSDDAIIHCAPNPVVEFAEDIGALGLKPEKRFSNS